MLAEIIKIRFTEHLGDTIATRAAVKSLVRCQAKDVSNCEVVFDLDKVAFISRSAAHQLLLEKERLEKVVKVVSITNKSNELDKMLEIVQKSRETPREVNPIPTSNEILDWDDFEDEG